MKASQMVERKFLAKEDLDGGEVIVTIARIGQANVAQQDAPEEKKWAIKFKEFQKAMILNSTNIQLIIKALGTDETDEWIGREVVLYVDDNVSFGGKLVGGIRVRSAAPTKAPKRISPKDLSDLESDVPF